MSPSAIALILTAAFLHATWNLLLKSSTDRQIAAWLGNSAGALFYAPLLLWFGPPGNIIAWACLLIGGLTEAIYIYLLTKAYDVGDFSVVYTIARGSAPLFVSLWSMLLLNEGPSLLGFTGIVLAVLGIILVGAPGLGQIKATFSPLAILLALLTGLSIAVYTVVDRIGVQHTVPVSYGITMFMLLSVFFTPYVMKRRAFQTVRVVAVIDRKGIAAVAVLSPLAYLLVLTALSFTPASYVSAGREVSVVIGAMLGWLLLQEPFGLRRTVGAGVVTSGLALLSLAR